MIIIRKRFSAKWMSLKWVCIWYNFRNILIISVRIQYNQTITPIDRKCYIMTVTYQDTTNREPSEFEWGLTALTCYVARCWKVFSQKGNVKLSYCKKYFIHLKFCIVVKRKWKNANAFVIFFNMLRIIL